MPETYLTLDSPEIGEWLEDSPSGRYSRYSISLGDSDSAWLCMNCLHTHEDCQCADADERAREDPCFI